MVKKEDLFIAFEAYDVAKKMEKENRNPFTTLDFSKLKTSCGIVSTAVDIDPNNPGQLPPTEVGGLSMPTRVSTRCEIQAPCGSLVGQTSSGG